MSWLSYSFPNEYSFVGSLDGIQADVGIGLFAVLFLATGIAEVLAVAFLERRLPAPRRLLLSVLGYGPLFALATYTVLSFVIECAILLAHWLGNLATGTAHNLGASLI